MGYELKDEDYLKLWMYFEDKATSIKGAMFKTVTWTIGFAVALLAFAFDRLTDSYSSAASLPLNSIVLATAIAGLFICGYSCLAIHESAIHIQDNWDRANRCRDHVKDLGQILFVQNIRPNNPQAEQNEGISAQKKRKRAPMKIWNQLYVVVSLFALVFIVLLARGLAKVLLG